MDFNRPSTPASCTLSRLPPSSQTSVQSMPPRPKIVQIVATHCRACQCTHTTGELNCTATILCLLIGLHYARPASEASKAEKSSKGDTNISKEYLIVQDVFDIIPAVCHLAADKRHKNTICYANFVGIMQTLAVQVR